jgi:hypothetical protein
LGIVINYIEGWYNTVGSIPRSATSALPSTSRSTTAPPDRRHDPLKMKVGFQRQGELLAVVGDKPGQFATPLSWMRGTSSFPGGRTG